MRPGDEVFAEWYRTAHGSGPGSTLETTRRFREFLEEFIYGRKIKTILDYGCGDGRWMSAVALFGATYLGVDIIPEAIAHARDTSSTESRTYEVIDPETYDVPRADLIICKDVLQHLPDSEARSLIARLTAKAKYVLFVNDGPHGDEPVNGACDRGGWRRLDLAALGVPGRVVLDGFGNEPDHKQAFLWSAKETSSMTTSIPHIPFILNHVWPGQDPFRYPEWRATWLAKYPDATMRFWRGAPPGDPRMQALLEDDRYTPVVKADILRWGVLYAEGGVYLDTDMECGSTGGDMRPLLADPKGCWIAEECEGRVCPSIIAATPGHPFVKRMIDALFANLAAVPPELANADPVTVTGPLFVSHMCREHADEVTVHSYHRFYPVFYNATRESAPLEKAVCNHHWKGAWKEKGPGWRESTAETLPAPAYGTVLCVVCEKPCDPTADDWNFEPSGHCHLACRSGLAPRVEFVRSGRPNLICISRGPWGIPTVREADANWDWVEFHWKPRETRAFRDGFHSSSKPDHVIEETAPRFKQSSVIAKYAEELHLDRYERVAQVSDDTRCDGTWSEAFDLLRFWEAARGIKIAQLSHSRESHWSHAYSKHTDDGIVAREVTHVDDVAPIFTREALRRMLPYFAGNTVFDWSMDRLWSSLGLPMMVFNTLTMTHTKAEQTSMRDLSRWGGKTGAQWMTELQRQYPDLPPMGGIRATHAWAEGPGDDEVRRGAFAGAEYAGVLPPTMHRVPLALQPGVPPDPSKIVWCFACRTVAAAYAIGAAPLCRGCLAKGALAAMGVEFRDEA